MVRETLTIARNLQATLDWLKPHAQSPNLTPRFETIEHAGKRSGVGRWRHRSVGRWRHRSLGRWRPVTAVIAADVGGAVKVGTPVQAEN